MNVVEREPMHYDPIMSNIATGLICFAIVMIVAIGVYLITVGIKRRRKLKEISDRRKGWI